MEHKLIAESFMIKLDVQVFESDISYPINTSIKIYVESEGFSAATTIDIDIKELSRFAIDLRNLYDSLKGSAMLREPYGSDIYLEFSGEDDGGIKVRGHLRNLSKNGILQELNFANEFDQSYLNDFQEKLSASYHKYLK